ncbi:hypothetical protein HDV02_006232 [Globomyces sp. JEL0801]|nr:hypothetical protein HDV02_006232 [Globomyces sp. JEL0801]
MAGKPVEIMGVKHFCSTCQILTNDILQIPMMDMVLDDGTLQMEFDLSLHVCRELVHDQGIASLDGLLFETLHFGITNFRNAFRIDQICFDPPIYSQILDWKIDQSKVKRIRH